MAFAKKYLAVWYDREKVERLARAAGWNGTDSLLDVYHPEENSHKAASAESFATLDAAVAHAQKMIAKDFWGQTKVREFEVVPRGRRCRYCICGGDRAVREHTVEENGIVESYSSNDCAEDD